MENQPDFSFPTRTDDEIDLKQVYEALRRRKSLIAKITAATVLLSGIYAFTRKPVWQGQFEIVLASAQSPTSQASALLQSNPGLASLIGAGGGNEQLETEVEILESPSVLKPVFDFVKQQKQQKGIDTQDWRYADWLKGSLTIELVKGTSVLELAYRDTDKDLVLPTDSKNFWTPTKSIQVGIANGASSKPSNTLTNRLTSIMAREASNPLRAAQEYGIEHKLDSTTGRRRQR